MSDVQEIRAALSEFWAATGSTPLPVLSTVDSPAPDDRSAFRTGLAAATSVAAVQASVAELTGSQPEAIDRSLALAGFTTHTLVDGEGFPKWNSLSGHYRTGDGRFVQLHCNFPHHAAGAAKRLGADLERSAFEKAMLQWNAFELEAALIEDGMICAAYRTLSEWEDHPHAATVANLPIVSMKPLALGSPAPAKEGIAPLSGVRVIDCSRVLAGPVAGNTLANLGADVIRVGADHLPHVELCVIATGAGKRNTSIDLRTSEGRESFVQLVRDADLVIDAFRPGALAQYGFGPEEIAAISDRTSVVQVCAFDWEGPWGGRRGFDSIVQSTTGIALAGMEMAGSDTPTHLPVQVLDYATGLFAAAAAIRCVHHTRTVGGSNNAKLSLIRTRNWFCGLGGPVPFEPGSIVPDSSQTATIDSDFGTLEMVRPFIGEWQHGPQHLGTSAPTWHQRHTG